VRHAFQFAAGLAATFCCTSALAASPWYISGSVGGYFREGDTQSGNYYKILDPSITTTATNSFSFDPGVILNAAVGYKLSSRFRVEAEIGYTNFTADNLRPFSENPNFPGLKGQIYSRENGFDFSRFSGTVNAFYDFAPIASRFTPYVGVGIGGTANHKSAGAFANADGNTFRFSSASGSDASGLLEGGVNIALSRHWSIAPAYRYVHFFNSIEDRAHVAKLGVRYSF